MWGTRGVAFGVIGVMGLLVGCGGGDVMAPVPSIYSGEWQDSQTTNAGCGFPGGTVFDQVETAVNGNQITLRSNIDCSASIWTLSGNTASRSFTQDRSVPNGNGNTCTFTEVLNATITFTSSNDYTMQAQESVAYKSGDCSSQPYVPCQVSGTTAATRCQGCFTGCTFESETRSATETRNRSLFSGPGAFGH